MVRPIVLYGNSILKMKAKDINLDYPKLKEVIADMFDTMKYAKGVGLAAPQIGLSIRLFIVDSTVYYDEEDAPKGFKKVFINPIMLEEYGQEWAFEEGCLSIPGINAEVNRNTHIKIKYLDENFNEHIETFDEINARIIQHEYDHIEGKLFIEKINPMRRQLLNGKLNKIKKGQVEAKYPVKS